MNKNRKGFTIVELVIVIAIIAILAAVLIPTFASLIAKANVSVDTQLVRNLNNALTAEKAGGENNKTMDDALKMTKSAGYDIDTIVSKSGNNIAWDSKNDRFVLIDPNNNTYIYPTENGAGSQTIANPVDFFVIYNEVPTAQKYSIYLSKNATVTEANVTVGFDAGENTAVTALTYTGVGTAQNVVIRTNGNTDLTVNGYVDAADSKNGDAIYHYGQAGTVNVIKCASASYHVYGRVFGTISVKQGHVAVENDAVVTSIVVPADATGKVAVTNKGNVSIINTTEASAVADVKVKNEGSIDVSVGDMTISGNQSEANYSEIKVLTSDTHEITEGGYYDATGVTISSTGTSGNAQFAITINTTEKVVIDGATLTGLRGVKILPAGSDFTLINSTVTVSQRGIQLWFDEGQANSGCVINVINCNFSNTQVTDYDNNTTSGTTGIILNGSENTKVNVMKSTIQGFGYSISSNYYNGAGGNKNVEINVDDCIFKGRAGFDLIALTDSVINVNNSLIRGINIYEGPTENFGLFVFEANSNNNTMNLQNCTFEGYRAPATAYNQEFLFNIWSTAGGNTINILGTNTMYEDIYFNMDSENVPSGYEDLMSMICNAGANNTINGTLVKATCVIHQGDSSVEYDWLK